MASPKIGFVGLTHLGLCYSSASAEQGFNVFAFDQNKTRINNLLKAKTSIYEKKLEYLIKKNLGNKLKFFNNFNNLKKCDVVFISEDVPTDSGGKSNLLSLKRIIDKTIRYLKKDATLVILSQVPPGYNRKIRWNKNRLYYQVETLIFGKGISRALKPERIIVGSDNSKTTLSKSYNIFLCSFKCPIIRMNYESAELTKIAINMFLISSVSNANLLSLLCEKIGADWHDVIPALRKDKRIGRYSYIEPGLGLSGGNLERDLYTLKNLSQKLKVKDRIINSFIYSSNNHKLWVYNKLKELVLSKKRKFKISLLGLSYKENTNSIKNSASIYLLKKLKKYEVVTYDPEANIEDVSFNIIRMNSIEEAIRNADVLIIMTKWDEFSNIKKKLIISLMKGNIIIDPYGVLKKLNLEKYKFNYNRLGKKINMAFNNLFKKDTKPNRVVVLGSNGFISSAVINRLSDLNINTLNISRKEFDLENSNSVDGLSNLIDERDTILFVAANAPVKNESMLLSNFLICKNICQLLNKKKINHLIYISSDAVYKDSMKLIDEASCAEPDSLHGLMHLSREVMIQNSYNGDLCILRPTLVFGIADPHNGYGPNSFF